MHTVSLCIPFQAGVLVAHRVPTSDARGKWGPSGCETQDLANESQKNCAKAKKPALKPKKPALKPKTPALKPKILVECVRAAAHDVATADRHRPADLEVRTPSFDPIRSFDGSYAFVSEVSPLPRPPHCPPPPAMRRVRRQPAALRHLPYGDVTKNTPAPPHSLPNVSSIGHNCVVHATDNKKLEWAASNGHDAVVARLLAAGADVHAKDDAALRLAASNGHDAVVARLLTAGANVSADNFSALEWAAKGHHNVVVALLLHGVMRRASRKIDPQP